MTQELKDRLMAAYGEDRFTMTVSEISARAGTRRRRLLLQLAAASVVVLVVAAGALLQPRHHASPLTPLPSPSPSVAPLDWVAFTANCLKSWNTAKFGPLPANPVKREKAGAGLLIYADDISVLACEGGRNGYTASLSNSERKPVYPAMFAEGLGLGTEHGYRLFVGTVPAGAIAVEYLIGGKAYRAEMIGQLYALWEPHGIPGDLGNAMARVRYPRQVAITHLPRNPAGLSAPYRPGDVSQWCLQTMGEVPVPGTKSSPPVEIFARDLGDDRAVHFFGDDEVLVSCGVSLSANSSGGLALSHRPEGVGREPFEQLYGRDYVFGRAPEGAVSGKATLRSGRTISLSIKDGFYFATWTASSDLVEDPVNVEIRTAGGQVISSPR